MSKSIKERAIDLAFDVIIFLYKLARFFGYLAVFGFILATILHVLRAYFNIDIVKLLYPNH